MAIDFDATDDAIDCGRVAAIEGVSALTVSMWVQLDSYVAWGYNCSKFESSTSAIGISQYDTAAKWAVFVRNGGNTYGYTSDNVYDLVNWHHLCSVFDGSGADNFQRLKLYHNGVPQAVIYNGTIPATISATTQEFCIGARDNAGNAEMNGRCDEAAIWTAALSADQVATLACGVKGLPLKMQPASLVAYWPMDEHPHGTAVPADAGYVRDLSGNGNDGTRVGDPYYNEGVLSYPGWPVYVHAEEVAEDVIATPGALALTGAQHTPTVTHDFLVGIAAELEIAATPQTPTTIAQTLRVLLIEDELHV